MPGIGNMQSIATWGWFPEGGADMWSIGTWGWWLTSVVDLQVALYQGAMADSGVQALVGQRVYRVGQVPQTPARPYLVYQRVADPPHRDQVGQRMREATYRFHCVAADVDAAQTLSDAVLSWLDRYRGFMGLPTQPVEVRRAFLQSRSHAPEPPSDGSARGPHIIEATFAIFYLNG